MFLYNVFNVIFKVSCEIGRCSKLFLMKKCTFLVQRSILLQRTKIDFLEWTILTADVTMQSIHSQRAKVDKINF